MRLVLMKEPKTNCLVALKPGGAVRWDNVGDVSEDLPPEVAYEILNQYPEHLAKYEGTSIEKAAKPVKDNKMLGETANKSG